MLRGGVVAQFTALRRGQRAKIIGYRQGQLIYKQRLLAMGLLPGSTFEVLNVAPLGDPVAILIRGYTLSLRKQEADILRLELVEE